MQLLPYVSIRFIQAHLKSRYIYLSSHLREMSWIESVDIHEVHSSRLIQYLYSHADFEEIYNVITVTINCVSLVALSETL